MVPKIEGAYAGGQSEPGNEEGPERRVASGLAVVVRVAPAGMVGVSDGAT